MPTRLPSRRNFLRRFAPDAETARNLTATAAEFGFALLFVTVTVVIIQLASTRGGRLLSAVPAAPVAAVQ